MALILLTFVATDLRRRSGVIRGFKAAGNTAPGQQPDINLGLSAHGMAAIAANSELLCQITDPCNSEGGEGIKGPAWPPPLHDGGNQEIKPNEDSQKAHAFSEAGDLGSRPAPQICSALV